MTMHFAELLAMEEAADHRFTFRPPGSGFLYGGLSMAMALRAAAATTDRSRTPLSLHVTFTGGGAWEGPHQLQVQPVNDSRAFTGRRVEMTTTERLAVVADVALHQPEAGDDWQTELAPDVAGPDDLEPYRDKMPAPVLEVRPVLASSSNVMQRIHPLWARTTEPIDDDATLAACALAFASDYRVFSSPFATGSDEGAGLMSRTHSHTLTFHRPLQGTRWWLFRCEPLTVAGGRFVSRGTVQGIDGALLASFVQLGYIRPAP